MLSDLQAHYLRILHERDSLRARVGALEFGMKGNTFIPSKREAELLVSQLDAMKAYLLILEERANVFKSEHPQELGKYPG